MQKKIELWQKLFGTKKANRPKSAGQTALTEGEIAEIQRSAPEHKPPNEKEREEALAKLEQRYRGLQAAY